MSALAARHLVSAGASAINVTNRSPERAQNLAKEVEGLARPWEELPGLIAASDVVITSTGSREPILTRKVMKQALKKRRYRPQVIVDIAVPRDVEASVATLDGAYLFDIDDLERVVAENLRERKKEAEAAEEIVGEAVDAFSSWLHQLKVVPTIRSLRDRFTEVANREAEKTIRTLDRDHTPEERAKAIRRLSQLIVNKLLHTPTTALKGGSSDEVEQFVEVTNRLFDLSSAEKEEASDSSEAGESGDDIDEIKRGSA